MAYCDSYCLGSGHIKGLRQKHRTTKTHRSEERVPTLPPIPLSQTKQEKTLVKHTVEGGNPTGLSLDLSCENANSNLTTHFPFDMKFR